jgi:Arc/MetJ-type ribon-helix-helix transcriptional regulator
MGVTQAMANPASHGNVSAEDVQSAVGGIEQAHRDLLAERGAYMQRCRVIRDAITAIYEEAKDKGIGKKALRAKVKNRSHLRKAEEARLALEADEQNEFDNLTEMLGDFANTPLGKAALQRQGDILDKLHA